jgi:hypothetical protein
MNLNVLTVRTGCSRNPFRYTARNRLCTAPYSGQRWLLGRFHSTRPPALIQETWVDRLPPKVRPYLYLTRIDKPIGTLLLFYPCGEYAKKNQRKRNTFRDVLSLAAWSITMASYALHLPYTAPLTYLTIFGVGALVMRGAGCTINDMWDRKLDKNVGERWGRQHGVQTTSFMD